MRLRYFLAGFVAAATLLAGVQTTAQSVQVERVTPRVMTGSEVGFRVEGLRGGTPVGTIVVQVNGQWVAADIGSLLLTAPLTDR
jgi:hypothetical protein